MKRDEFLHLLDKLDIMDTRLDSINSELSSRRPIIDKIPVIEEDVAELTAFKTSIKSIVGLLTFMAGGVGLFEYFRR